MSTTSTPGAAPSTCHTDSPAVTRDTRRRRMRKLALHYVEMVIAMAVGMVALHPVWTFAFDALGWSALTRSCAPAVPVRDGSVDGVRRGGQERSRTTAHATPVAPQSKPCTVDSA